MRGIFLQWWFMKSLAFLFFSAFLLFACSEEDLKNAGNEQSIQEKAGNESPPEGTAEAMWEMEKKMWRQREQQQ